MVNSPHNARPRAGWVHQDVCDVRVALRINLYTDTFVYATCAYIHGVLWRYGDTQICVVYTHEHTVTGVCAHLHLSPTITDTSGSWDWVRLYREAPPIHVGIAAHNSIQCGDAIGGASKLFGRAEASCLATDASCQRHNQSIG